MGNGSDLFALDTGDSPQIEKLARRVMRLSGLTVRDANDPHGNIEIEYSGLRPGKMVCEELLIGREVTGIGDPIIMRVPAIYDLG